MLGTSEVVVLSVVLEVVVKAMLVELDDSDALLLEDR